MTASASPSSGTTSLSSLLSIALRLKSSSGRIDMTNLPFFGGEQDPKLLQPPAGRGLDGSLGDVEGGGGLGDRGVEQVTANKHLPLDGGQPPHDADQHVPTVNRLGERGDIRHLVRVRQDAWC